MSPASLSSSASDATLDGETPHAKKEEDILALKGGGDHHMAYMLVYRALYAKEPIAVNDESGAKPME